MAKSCKACQDLQVDAPNLIVNGLTATEIASLKNNTGLNPSSGNDDCTDLNNMNDCLIGNMSDEIDAFDVCDWKDYTKNYVNNVWTMFKAIICAVCGLWTNLKNLSDRIDSMCQLLDANMRHPVYANGTLPNGDDPSHQGGVITNKGGKPMLTPLSRSEVTSDDAWKQQNVGFRYGKLTAKDCNGACRRHEWIAPDLYAYRFNAEVEPAYDDMLWSIDKASVVGRMGMTNELWAIRAQNPVTWASDWTAGGALIALRLSVEDDRLVLRYRGKIGDSAVTLAGQQIIPPADQAERLYRFSC